MNELLKHAHQIMVDSEGRLEKSDMSMSLVIECQYACFVDE
jgi:hypothetical protein